MTKKIRSIRRYAPGIADQRTSEAVNQITFAGSGVITALGGNGFTGGGGGGGGGGWVTVIYGYGSAPTINVTGGTKGTSGTGSAGADGGAGLSYVFAVGA